MGNRKYEDWFPDASRKDLEKLGRAAFTSLYDDELLYLLSYLKFPQGVPRDSTYNDFRTLQARRFVDEWRVTTSFSDEICEQFGRVLLYRLNKDKFMQLIASLRGVL